MLSGAQITPSEEIRFRISYEVLNDIETYIAFSLTDLDRNIWIYNDNSMDTMTKGRGHKECVYSCKLEKVNDIKMKLEVSIRDKSKKMISYSDSANTPIIVINRNDLALDDKSGRDSATGLIQRNGFWNING